MNKPLEQLLKDATKDLLSEESLKAITDAFSLQVESAAQTMYNETAKASTEAAVGLALEKQDIEYAEKLGQLLEAIDTDHFAKLEKIVARIDENHCAKLKVLAEKYDTNAKKEAAAFKKTLVEKVSKYLDIRLAEAIPTVQLTEAINNTRAKKIIKRVQEAVALDESFVTSEIRDALEDGKTQITESQKQVAALQGQVKTLNEQTAKLNVSLLLERKTAGLPKEKKDYAFKILSSKPEKFINENFNYVLEMFEQKEEETVEELKESAEAVTAKQGIDQPVAVTESTEQIAPEMVGYMEGLQGPK